MLPSSSPLARGGWPCSRLFLLVAGLGATAAGCSSSVVIAAEDLPHVLREHERADGGEVRFVDTRGETRTVPGGFERVILRPKEGRVFMRSPTPGALVIGVPAEHRERLSDEGWSRVTTNLKMPVGAELSDTTLLVREDPIHPCTLSATSRDCHATAASTYAPPVPRAFAIRPDAIGDVKLTSPDPVGDVALGLGIALGVCAAGALALLAGIASNPH